MNLPASIAAVPGSDSTPTCLVGVIADPAQDPAVFDRARKIGIELHLPLLSDLPQAAHPRSRAQENSDDQAALMVVGVTSDRIEIRVIQGEEGLRGGNPVYVNLMAIDVSSPFGRSLQQPLAKAIGRKRYADPAPSVLDVTAGLGEDSWVMAALGCQVTSVERNGVISLLLENGLERARLIKPEIADRIRLVRANGIDVLRELANAKEDDRPDIVFIDPMFPTGRKSREQKSMRVVRCLVGDDLDAAGLVGLARKVARKRVVIKRPLHAPGLEDAQIGKPHVVHKGKSLRFDVFVAGMHAGPERA